MPCKIELTKGEFAIVDDRDAEWASKYKWYAHSTGRKSYYAARRTSRPNSRFVYMHREILRRAGRNLDNLLVDHINGDGLDNRRDNLRAATPSQNVQNRTKAKKENKTGYMGVYQAGNKWSANIWVNKEYHYLGLYDTPAEAARAYDEGARRLHGEFATLNFPDARALEAAAARVG